MLIYDALNNGFFCICGSITTINFIIAIEGIIFNQAVVPQTTANNRNILIVGCNLWKQALSCISE